MFYCWSLRLKQWRDSTHWTSVQRLNQGEIELYNWTETKFLSGAGNGLKESTYIRIHKYQMERRSGKELAFIDQLFYPVLFVHIIPLI